MTEDLARYHRQMRLPGFAEAGQRRLGAARAVVFGCGALGSVAADMLARAGVGHLTLVDRDFVELTNLQRQVLFDEDDVAAALPKAEAARRKLARINSDIVVDAIIDDINHKTIRRMAAGADILVDGLDNFETRYLANDFAVANGIPYVYGGAVGTSGAAFTVLPHTVDGTAAWEASGERSYATPCLRCLFVEAPPPGMSPTCETAGVLGPVVAMIANFEVAETLKVLTGSFDRVCRDLVTIDVWNTQFHQFKVESAYETGDCPCCKQRRFDHLEGRAGAGAATLCGRNAVQLIHRQHQDPPDLAEIAQRLRALGTVKTSPFMLRAELADRGSAFELTLFRDGRAIIHGTADPNVARSLYSRFVGN